MVVISCGFCGISVVGVVFVSRLLFSWALWSSAEEEEEEEEEEEGGGGGGGGEGSGVGGARLQRVGQYLPRRAIRTSRRAAGAAVPASGGGAGVGGGVGAARVAR